MLSRFVIAFLPSSKCVLISWLQSHRIQTGYFSHHKKPSLDPTSLTATLCLCSSMADFFIKVIYTSVSVPSHSLKSPPLVDMIYVCHPITLLKSLLSVIFDLYLSPGGTDHSLLETLSSGNCQYPSLSYIFASLTGLPFTVSFAVSSSPAS